MTALEPSQTIETAVIEDTSLLAFYRDMNLPERRTFWACATGWALDGMDFMIYPLVIGTIIKLWSVDAGTAGLAGTATLLSSAVGGWLGGYLADRIGRVRTLQFTIIWFSFFSLICAIVQNFDQLLIARALLGLGFGGEWAAGAVLMGEAIRPQYRGRAVGSVQSGWAVGWGLAALAQAILFSYLPAEIAWRWMFAIGALPALLVFYLRSYVTESEIAAAARIKQTEAGNRPQLWEIFSAPILKTTILASLMVTGCQGGYYAITFWVPQFLTKERHLSIVGSTGYLAALIIGSFIGYLVGAWLADRIGRRNLFLIFSLGAIAIVLLYTQLTLSNEILWVLGFRWASSRPAISRESARSSPSFTRPGCVAPARASAIISAVASARCSRSWSARFRPRRRLRMRLRSSQSRPTACSSLPPSRCRKRAGAYCMRTPEAG